MQRPSLCWVSISKHWMTSRALNAFQRAVELDTKMTDAWITLGEIYESKNDQLQWSILTASCWWSGIIASPCMLRRIIYKIIIKYLEALAIYKDIILKDRNYTDTYLNSGVLYMEMDSLQRRDKESFDLMAKVAPTNYMGFLCWESCTKIRSKGYCLTKLSVCVPFKRKIKR